jgi:hypothetical protein
VVIAGAPLAIPTGAIVATVLIFDADELLEAVLRKDFVAQVPLAVVRRGIFAARDQFGQTAHLGPERHVILGAAVLVRP